MKKFIKDWWPVLVIAGLWLWKKLRRDLNLLYVPKAETPTPPQYDPFNGGACVYGPPEMY